MRSLTTLLLICTLFFGQVLIASDQTYTCPSVSMDEADLDYSCYDKASAEVRYKSNLMMRNVLAHIRRLEKLIGPQTVLFVARAGESLIGFNQLQFEKEDGSNLDLETIFQATKKQFPYIEANDFATYAGRYDNIYDSDHNSYVSQARIHIAKTFANKERKKMTFSHAAFFYKTDQLDENGDPKWEVVHELMPCNEKRRSYPYFEHTTPHLSKFFLDKPSAYKALVIPLQPHIQRTIAKAINNNNQGIAVGRVYRAMASPWQADDQNSNSFVLELLEGALLGDEYYDYLVDNYKQRVSALVDYFNDKKVELNDGKALSNEQRKALRTDPAYQRVCRPDYEPRKRIVESYTNRGYKPTKVVIAEDFGLRGLFSKQGWQSIRVNFIDTFIVGEHVKPDLKIYKKYIDLGIGEAVSVHSIRRYISETGAAHPEAPESWYEVPEMKYVHIKNYVDEIRRNIKHNFSGAKFKESQCEYLKDQNRNLYAKCKRHIFECERADYDLDWCMDEKIKSEEKAFAKVVRDMKAGQ